MLRTSFHLCKQTFASQKCILLAIRKFSYKPVNKKLSTMYKNISSRIKACGPISVADYMKEVLTHPTEGYYMKKDVFGEKGDFITSPEISQLFGEMIAVWIASEMGKINSGRFQLVELGPGRGTLSKDILRVLHRLKVADKLSLHLVELSPALSKIQAESLCEKYEEHVPDVNEAQKNAITYYRKGSTKEGVEVFWYYSIRDVPKEFSVFLAHEFFDALPIHKFQRTKDGWREVLIDIDTTETEDERFRYVITKAATLSSQFYIDPNEEREHVEVSPQGIVIVDYMANFLSECGGIALVIDYGHDGEKTDTFRAFRRHTQHDPLLEPGTADLTADVDFSVLKKIAQKDGRVICFGPVNQNEFLKKGGIDLRLRVLQSIAADKEARFLKQGYEKIMSDDQMGSRFKALAMFPAVLKEHLSKWPVNGF